MIQTLRSRRAILATASLVSTLTDTLGGPLLVSGGGTVDAKTHSFAANQGLSLSNGLASGINYSIGLLFNFDTATSCRWVLDFKNLVVDAGFYIVDSMFTLYPVTGAFGPFPTSTTVPAVLTRDGATNVVSSYANWMSRHLDLKASPYTCTSYGRFR